VRCSSVDLTNDPPSPPRASLFPSSPRTGVITPGLLLGIAGRKACQQETGFSFLREQPAQQAEGFAVVIGPGVPSGAKSCAVAE
jgi:hypothetical protein